MDSPYFWQNLKWVFHLPDVVWTPNLPSCLQDFFTARTFSLLSQRSKSALPSSWTTVLSQEAEKESVRFNNVYILQNELFSIIGTHFAKALSFLNVPTTMWRKKPLPHSKKSCRGLIFYPSPTPEVGFGLFLWNVFWNSSKNSRKEGTDFWEPVAPPLRNLRRLRGPRGHSSSAGLLYLY